MGIGGVIRFTQFGDPCCPECEHGALKHPDDLRRGYCGVCYMLKHAGLRIEREKHQDSEAYQRWTAHLARFAAPSEGTFKTDAECYEYDRSIYDRD